MSDKKNTIGRFEIIEKIGEGPIGAVYKALDPVIRRTVAIKVIKLYTLEETATFAEVFEKIYRVVRTSTALNHPNICIIYDLSEEKKIPFITMEFVDGHDVEWLLQSRHQFKRAEVLNILQQTCDALDFAHRKSVIHQDLKSTNIILTSEMHVKITDFGIAGLDEIAAAQTKKLLSIPYYISPEQALGEKVTPASDLFSLGIIMYQLLSGQLPFPGTSAANVIMMIARDNPQLPKDLEKSGIKKDDWDSFFNIALSKAPGQRFRSAKEMFDALSAILPAGETRYYPYSFQGEAITPEKMEKTFVNETPTVMIDPSQFAQESAPEPAPEPPAPMEATMIVQQASAFDLLDEVAPAAAPPEAEDATVHVSREQLEAAAAAPPTMMIEIPKQPLKPEPVPEQPPFVSASAPTQMISMQDFAQSDLRMDSVPETPAPTQYDEISLPDAELPDMATMMVQREPAPAPPPPPPPKPPQPEPMLTMRPTVPEPEPSALAEQAPEEDIGMTIRPTPPPPPPAVKAPKEKKEKKKETGKFQAPVLPPEPPAPPPSQEPAPAPPPVAPAGTASVPRPAAAQPKPGGGSLKLLGLIAVVIALLVLIVGGIFIIPKLTKKEEPPPQPLPTPIKVEPRPEPPQPTPEPAPQLPTAGKISLSSEPTGATVFVDDQEKGVTPLDIPDLPFGKHVIKLSLKGYQDNQQEVQLSEDLAELAVPTVKLEKAVAQMGTLVVESEPSGAFIIINNRAVGTTPKTLANQKPGKVSVTLKKDGYRDFSETIKISAGKSASLKGTLEEIPKPVVEPPKPVKPVEPEVKPGELVALTADVTPPKALKKAFAKYPDAARRQRLEGVVGLSLLVSETGQVIDVKVTKSANPILDEAAVAAVKQWQYQPATKKGVVVKVWIPVSMSFQAGR